MKIRKGFVSNSSSSSFIVAVDPMVNPKGRVTIQIDVDLNEMGRTLRNEQEVKDYCKDRYYGDNEYEQKMLAAVKAGKFVIIGEFSSDSGNSVEQMLCEEGLPEKIRGAKIIYSQAGY